MIEKQDDPRLKTQKQKITRFEGYRQKIKTNLNYSMVSLNEAQKACLDEGSVQMKLFAAEKLQREIDQLEKLIRHVDSLLPENIT